MKTLLPVAIVLAFSTQLAAQTSGDDLAATENWWDRVGAQFFSDEGLTTVRPEPEIRAQWTALSSDDQAAVLARCDALEGIGTGEATSLQEGSNTGSGGMNDADEAVDNANETPADGALVDRQTEKAASGGQTTEPADQTSVTGALDGKEIQQPADGTIGYTGLAGGRPEDAAFAPVCALIRDI